MAQQPTKNAAVMARQQALGDLAPMRPASNYTFDELYRLGQVLHASGLYEDVKDAAQATVKILKGQELGIPPTSAMSAFDIIQKKLFIKPWAIAAKINSCGYGFYRITRQDADACHILFTRKYPGMGWVECGTVTYTIQEAQAHGLTSRSAHWKTNPAHMLYQRAMGRGGAMYFPELLAGLDVPQDTTPVTHVQAQSNVRTLFGDQPEGDNGTAYTPVKNVTPSGKSETTPSDWRTRVEELASYAKGAFGQQVWAALEDADYPEDQGEALAMQLADLAAAGE